jgi:hypothetical protein
MNNEQPLLFDLGDESLFLNIVDVEEVVEEYKRCIKCEELLPVDNFQIRSDGGFRRTECRKCTSILDKIRKVLRKENPPPNDMEFQCPICLKYGNELQGRGGKKTPAFVMDHCHETDTFRGYICQGCNRCVFRDDIPTIQRYIDHLQAHEDKLKAGTVIPREGSKAWIAQQS